MEWVEVTGRTLEEAKESALERLGVTEADAELIVLAEPKVGLFGRLRGEARVRARVRPVGPRPKRTRRSRGGRGRGPRSDESRREERPRSGEAPQAQADGAGGGQREVVAPAGGTGVAVPGGGRSSSARRRRRRSGSGPKSGGTVQATEGPRSSASASGESAGTELGGPPEAGGQEEMTMAEGVTLEEQARVAREFVEGLLDTYGLQATVTTRELDDDTIEVAANGDDLGLLVGPRGSTLAALQDVTRTVVQRRFPTRTDRIMVDVAGYRERRASALQRFSRQVAAEVVAEGSERALEPMSPADRKVVHDTINTIEGVVTRSEGEEPRRYIVIAPTS